MEFIVLLILSLVLGVSFGAWGAYFNTLLLEILQGAVIFIIIIGVLLSRFSPAMAHAGVGEGTLFSMLGDLYARIPPFIQWPLASFPLFFFIGRTGAHIYQRYYYVKPQETKTQRRGRILIDDTLN